MSRFIVAPCSKYNLEYLENINIDYILIGVDGFCITPMFRMDIDDIIEYAKISNKNIIVSLNKMMHNKDLNRLEEILNKIKTSNIDKVMFYDLSVLNISNRIKINKDLIISQEHLNTSFLSNNFYYNNGVNYSLLSSDITYEEINEIGKNSDIGLIVCVYGYLPIFYSRRYLITNYLDYINKKKKDDIYYIKHDESYYMIKEEKDGTIIYTNEVINLINELSKIKDIDYYLIDGSYVDDSEFKTIINNYLDNKKMIDTNTYFFDRKTTYRVKNNE